MKNKIQLFEIGKVLIAVLIALILGFIIILLVSEEPWYAFKSFLYGTLRTPRRIGNFVEMSIPLIFTGLAVAVVFEARQFNIGAEGQFFFGAVVATIFGIVFKLPAIIHIPLILIAAMAGGMLVGAIPGFLKARWGASELVSSLMLNYVFFRLGLYLINNHYRDTSAGAMVSWKIHETAWLKQFLPPTRIHWGVFLAIGAIIFTYYFLYRTKWGYALRMTGLNKNFAAYSGISVTAVILYSQVIGGAIAGLGGASEMLGIYRRFQWQMLPGYGFDGIIIAILARNKPLLVPVAALFLAYIRSGADIMARMSDVPAEIVAIIQGVIILLVTAQAFLSKYHHRLVVKEAKEHGQID